MNSLRCILTIAVVVAFGVCARAGEPEAKTLMTERGKLIFQDDLNKPLGKQWRVAKGKWEIVDGVLKGSELKADKHGAVARYPLPVQNVVIQYSFQLNGAKMTTLSINKKKGHLCRVKINAKGISVQKDDQDGKRGPDKAKVLMKLPVKIAPGQWHTLVLELHGKEMLATLDGKQILYGIHSMIDQPIGNIGLTVAGESVLFKNLRVWNAQPNKNWPATRARLMRESGKGAAGA